MKSAGFGTCYEHVHALNVIWYSTDATQVVPTPSAVSRGLGDSSDEAVRCYLTFICNGLVQSSKP